MNKTIIVYLLLIFLGMGQIYGQEIIDRLTSKTWKGTGTLMGSEANFEMSWRWTLDKKFLHLEFQNKRPIQDNNEQVFKARAYYKISPEGEIEGMWFDSRGIFFPLGGTVNDSELLINWGTPEIEQGRTIYNLKTDKEIAVTDFILKNEEYLPFGNASYKQ